MNGYKRRCGVVLAAALAAGPMLLVSTLLPDPAARAAGCDRYVVNPGGTDSGSCTAGSPCRSVQYALGQALDGDVICLADHTLVSGPSVYTGTINLIDDSVTLDGAWDAWYTLISGWHYQARACAPERVILDAQGAGRVVTVQAYITATLRCLSITGGVADSGGGVDSGYATVVISGCRIYSNTASSASGGVRLTNSDDLVLVGNEVFSNAANSGGGIGLLNARNVVLESNLVHGNTANFSAGGIRVFGSDNARLIGNRVYDNRLLHTVSSGGGIELYDSHHALLDGNQVYSNTAQAGSGIAVNQSAFFTLTNNVIAQNTATGTMGGAILVSGDAEDLSQGVLVNNSIAQNGAAGLVLHQYAVVTLTNNIIVSHGAGIYAKPFWPNVATADHTLFYGNTDDISGSVVSSIDPITGQPPCFVDPGAWDYHIRPDSPAVDAGATVSWLDIDIDGDARPWPGGGAYDVGADETEYHFLYLPLVMRDA